MDKNISLEDLDFSVQTWKCLRKAGIETLDELAAMSADDLLAIQNLGHKSLAEIAGKLQELGLTLEGYNPAAGKVVHNETVVPMGKRGYWSEIRNDFFESEADILPEEGDVLAKVSIDAWKTEDENEEGCVIACVMLSKHGDVLVDYRDGVARIDNAAQEAINEARKQLREYYFEQTKGRVEDIAPVYDAFSLGKSMFVDWENIDAAVNRWAKEYFGSHVEAQGSRDETSFEIEFQGFQHADYSKFCKLFEMYDVEKDYAPEEEFETGVCTSTLPACISRRLMQEALPERELASFGTAVATYDGVFFMENDRFEQKVNDRDVKHEPSKVSSWKELQEQYPMDRDEMTEEEETQFVEECFELYEKEGFSPKYWSPFTDNAERIGQIIEIVGRVEADLSHDLSVLPMWKARLDGQEFEVFPEEVIPSEMKANGCRWFEDVLEYDSSNPERLAGLPVDVCSPQECADNFGKAVRDGNRFYLPSDDYYLPKEPTSKVDTIIENAAERAVETSGNTTDKGLEIC